MPPNKQMCIVQLLLIRSLFAWFWKKPYKSKLVRWGPELYDKYMLPHYVEQDMKNIVTDLQEAGYPFQLSWLEPFFEFAAPFVAIDTGANWKARHAGAAPEAGTGIFAFDFGAEPQILARFMADPERAIAAYGNEQAYVQATARSMAFWPHGWVISFKRHLCQPVGLDLFLPPKSPPPDAKVIAFHGSPRPIDLIRPGRHRWATLPHSGRGPVPWLVDYWRENG